MAAIETATIKNKRLRCLWYWYNDEGTSNPTTQNPTQQTQRRHQQQPNNLATESDNGNSLH